MSNFMRWWCPPWGFPKGIPKGWNVEVWTVHLDPLFVASFTPGPP